jgi:hypothetical protein
MLDLLLKRDNPGNILEGSDQNLLERAVHGDDLTIYIEAPGYDEYIIFGNYVVSADRVSALSLPHLAHGDMPHPAKLDQEAICTSQYIYDSRTNNVLVKDFLDEGRTLTQVFTNNPYYRSYTWYSTRRYIDADFTDPADMPTYLERLKACGDQFKIRLEFVDDFKIVVKSDIIYFPYEHKDYLVKSGATVLPTEFVMNPAGYLSGGTPLFDHQDFSLAYLNIGSDKLVTIVHKQRFRADKQVDDHIREGTLMHLDEGRTGVSRVECDHTILVPKGGSST